MSLLSLAQEIKGNFNPATDKVNGAESIPAGEYEVVVSNVSYKMYEPSGWENVVVEMKIQTGEYAGRIENVSFSFIEQWNNKPISDFILKRNMKLAQKLAFLGNYEWLQDDFQDTQSIAVALKNIIGTEMMLTIKETPNKNDPEKPYRNYEVDAVEQVPNFGRDTQPQVSDSELPFL